MANAGYSSSIDMVNPGYTEPGFSDTSNLPPFLEDTLITQIPPFDSSGVDRSVPLYDAERTAVELGLAGNRQGDELTAWARDNVTLRDVVLAAAREVQRQDSPVHPYVIRSAAGVLGAAMLQVEAATGEFARENDDEFREAVLLLMSLYDEDLYPTGSPSPALRPLIGPSQSGVIGSDGSGKAEPGHAAQSETFGLDDETFRELSEILRQSRITAIGFDGKATKGSRLKAGNLSIDISAHSIDFTMFTDPPGRTPFNVWMSDNLPKFGEILLSAKDTFHKIPETDNNFLSYYYPDGEAENKIWIVFTRRGKSRDVDDSGRDPTMHSIVYELSVDKSQKLLASSDAPLIALIRRNPRVFDAFIAMVSPGLDRPPNAALGTPGLSAMPSRSVTVINYKLLEPTVLSRIGGNSATPFYAGGFDEHWLQAARRYEYDLAT